MWEGVGDRTKTATYWPLNSSGYDMVLIPASSLQLTWTSCRRGYIIIWCPPTSCERHNFVLNSTPRQSGHPWSDIFDRYTCYLHRCISSFDSLAGSEVSMQQVGVGHSREELPFVTRVMENSSIELTIPTPVKGICKQRKIIHIRDNPPLTLKLLMALR